MRGKKPFVMSAPREADDSSADDAFEANPQHLAAKKRVQQTQAQVDEVVGIMTESIAKVLERDQKLLELDDRADALEMHASQFEQSAGKLKNKFWLQNMKMLVALGLVFIILVAIIVYQFV